MEGAVIIDNELREVVQNVLLHGHIKPSDDAETLYYSGNRDDGKGMDDIWLIRRENLQDSDG